nr:unnamed protein product [Callosobruchus chinensis]
MDVCSYCLEYRGKIKHEKNPDHKATLVTEYTSHKLRAKRFFEILKKEGAHSKTDARQCLHAYYGWNQKVPKAPMKYCLSCLQYFEKYRNF